MYEPGRRKPDIVGRLPQWDLDGGLIGESAILPQIGKNGHLGYNSHLALRDLEDPYDDKDRHLPASGETASHARL
jgi:hypothetical protein